MSDKNVIVPILHAIDIYIALKADYKKMWSAEDFLLDFFPVVSEEDFREYLKWDLVDEKYRGNIEDAVSKLRARLIGLNKYATEEDTSSLKTML